MVYAPTKHKPMRWAPISRGLIAPEWQGYWRGLEKAVLAMEGGGAPYETLKHDFLLLAGTPIWGVTRYGTAMETDAVGDSYYWASGAWVPTKNVTILIHVEKTDATFRNSSAFGLSEFTHRCQAHVPYSNQTVYWDFGGSASPNRITASPSSFGSDIWVFRAGDSGMQIWQNGILLSSSATAVTRTATTGAFYIGRGQAAADLCRYAIFLFWTRELTNNEIIKISHNPFGPFCMAEEWAFKAPAAVGGVFTTYYFFGANWR